MGSVSGVWSTIHCIFYSYLLPIISLHLDIIYVHVICIKQRSLLSLERYQLLIVHWILVWNICLFWSHVHITTKETCYLSMRMAKILLLINFFLIEMDKAMIRTFWVLFESNDTWGLFSISCFSLIISRFGLTTPSYLLKITHSRQFLLIFTGRAFALTPKWQTFSC